MIPHTFGTSAPLTLGVEEELMILDVETLDQVPAVDRILAALEGVDLPGAAKTELFASVFELNTNACASASEVGKALVALRRAAAVAAESEGLAVAAAATHPFARPEDQAVVDDDRYHALIGYGGMTLRRQGVQGLHVHVAMPSPDDAWRCLEGVLPWLPVVLALSANSPWANGELTGMASNRGPIMAELPRGGVPPAFGSYAAWEAWVERLVAAELAEDYTRIWWDVRPHPRFGTLELRIADQPTDVGLSTAFAALMHALCAWALDTAGGEIDPGRRGDVIQNRWAATRFGPAARMLHPEGASPASATELGAELIERLRPYAATLGGADALDRVDPALCEGALQLGHADARAAAADVVARTVA